MQTLVLILFLLLSIITTMLSLKKSALFIAMLFLQLNLSAQNASSQPLHVVVAGLSHDHVGGILQQYNEKKVIIDGIAEDNNVLIERYTKRYNLPSSLFYSSLDDLLKKKKPQAVLAYNPISEHLSVVEKCAPLGIHVMVEKPLATTLADAKKIEALSKKYKIKVLTNYETTWYSSNQQAFLLLKNETNFGAIRKMVAHDGHEGPKEIGVSKEFLSWLTDPVKNGGGAVIDFGCYGANLMTWLMKGQKPLSVSATLKQIKPDVYPKVDDDATIVIEYPQATGIIEGSWNWPFSIKDMEVFGKTGYIQAVNPNTLRTKKNGDKEYVISEAKESLPEMKNNLAYLEAVLSGKISGEDDLSSLSNNLIVVEILEAAKLSAKTGRKIMLQK